MKFFSHMRSRSNLKNNAAEAQVYQHQQPAYHGDKTSFLVAHLPVKVLRQIFTSVCPHTLDNSHCSSEDSMTTEDRCPLCDMRDLSQCALVNRAWSEVAQNTLYHSIRIDIVHYCEREIDLSDKRKRRSRFDRNGDPKDPSQQRLQLLSRTVRENEYLAVRVQILKMPYMTRETNKPDLARTVSVLPNLRYVDLPDGFFSGDPSCATLRQEVQQRCPDIRRMKYYKGSEGNFSKLSQMHHWQNLENLELKGLRIEPDTLLFVLSSIPTLRELTLEEVPNLDNSILIPNPTLALFPPLNSLALKELPSITSYGLAAYLSRPETREVLTTLKLSETGITSQNLHEVLHTAPRLQSLWISETISHSFPLTPVPPLASSSLHNLHFEMIPASRSADPSVETYYNYLASSLLSGRLPALAELWAFSTTLPDLLLFPSSAPFAGRGAEQSRFSAYSVSSSYSSASQFGPSNHHATPSGLVSPLSLYTKAAFAPELEWSLTTIEPPSERNGRRGSASATRPLSLVLNGGPASPSSGGRAKDSVLVGNGFGGFLAVPTEDGGGGRPGSSYGMRSPGSAKSKEWMG